jgi:hypothetical protein
MSRYIHFTKLKHLIFPNGGSNYLPELSIAKTMKSRVLSPPGAPQAAAPCWIAPPDGFAKINVDASISRHGNKGTVAAICRDRSGRYLGASVLAVPGISDLGNTRGNCL